MGFLESLGETAKSLGGAAFAAPGTVYDLAGMALDDEDDDFSDVLAAVTKRAGDVTDPLLNPQTLTGLAIGKGVDAANWSLENILSEPIATFQVAMQHSSQQGTVSDRLGAVFNRDTWSQAYSIAQEESAGQAVAFGLLDPETDPFDYKDPYEQRTAKDHPLAGPSIAFGANAVGMWFLDPFVVAGKGVSLLRSRSTFHKLSADEAAGFYSAVTEGSRSGLLKDNLRSRVDKSIAWMEGRNRLGRHLEADEIYHGFPELKKYAAEPKVLAALLADTQHIADPLVRADTKRRILAVSAGDTSQIARLRDVQSASVRDVLSNMVRESTIDLKLLGANPVLAHEPMFIARLERQLDNLNSTKDIDKFMDGWNGYLDTLIGAPGEGMGIGHTMRNAPGVHMAGSRAIARLNDKGALRATKNAHERVDAWAAKHMSEVGSASSVFQKGLHTVPIVAVRTLGLLAAPVTKAPVAVSDALRTPQFTGRASLHDWGGATSQLDAMMRLSGVAPGARMKTLSEAYLAKSEPEKLRMIDRVESLSMNSLAESYATKYGREINRGYIEELMTRHFAKRGMTLAQLRGRAHAATEMTDEMLAMRGRSLGSAMDSARKQTATQGKRGYKTLSAPDRKWRVDQIDDNGTLLSLPLLEPQLVNTVPLLDMGIAKKLLDRDHSYLQRLSRAWADEDLELKKLASLKGGISKVTEKTIRARRASMDMLVDAGQRAMRVWKFSVLFRLGYPIRVVSDDHWRVWTQLGAGTFYGDNGRELISNLRHNVWDRRLAGRNELHNLKVQRQEIKGLLESDRMVAHPERRADLTKLKRQLSGHQTQVARLTRQLDDDGLDAAARTKVQERLDFQAAQVADKEAAIAFKREELGDHGPEDLQRKLAEIEEQIRLGPRGNRPDKHRIGESDVKMSDGTSLGGSFGGTKGEAWRTGTSSGDTFEIQYKGVEDRMFQAGNAGSFRTIQPGENGHLDAWADALNYQIRQSEVAMHFVKGGTVDEFVKWVKAPERAALRRRLAHFAHDPEDWGYRVQALVLDYTRGGELAEQLTKGRVSTSTLRKLFQDEAERPAVHGRSLADNLGTSHRSGFIGETMNRMMTWLASTPTDRLSRHPYFNSMYKQHARRIYEVKKSAFAKGDGKFGQADLDDIQATARKLAMNDLKRTLFDISAHSHAAHVMRFMSPFFAAHQEVIQRWWRIVADDPSVIHRFTLAFDYPRYLGLTIDTETGELVKPGEAIGKPSHRVLMQLPKAFGGPETDPNVLGKGGRPTAEWSKWSVGENSFNLVLQNGSITNPGAGPVVSMPFDFLAMKYAHEPEIDRMARVFNPFPPNSPLDAMFPATLKRLSGLVYGVTEKDITLGLGIGYREYNSAYEQHIKDLTVAFHLKKGREPNREETEDLMLEAGRHANVQMGLRVLWNAVSPAPARPDSKYSVIQHGWYKISEQARTEGHDFDWAHTQFKARFGEAYMPLIASGSNNPARLDATPGTAAAITRNADLLKRLDPSLHRMVIGPDADDAAKMDPAMAEYSPTVRNYLRNKHMRSGSSDTYYSSDEPRLAFEEAMASRGWQQYAELTGTLTAQAQQMGLASYQESDQLVALKRAGVARIAADNYAFRADYASFDTDKFNRSLEGMQSIVKSLGRDSERTDIKTLGTYLELREMFTNILDQRKTAGIGGPDAQENEGIRKVYTTLVGKLVESNTYFEAHMYNGVIEFDPLLVGD